jgi:hypothetical protein
MGMPTQETARNVGDVGAAATGVMALVGYLPAIAAALTIVWTFCRLVEMFTGKPFHESRIAKLIVALARRFIPGRE